MNGLGNIIYVQGKGSAGEQTVEERYSVKVWAAVYFEIVKKMAGR